jgi:hypothetical protein
MKRNIEDALAACGRDRVMQREFGAKPSIAIRFDPERRVVAADGTASFLVREADTLDEAGALAAAAFAARLREIATDLVAQAERIERALKAATP